MKTEIQVRGMHCQHCVRAVDAALKQIPGVMRVEVSVGTAVLFTNDEPTIDELPIAAAESRREAFRRIIRNALEEAGFELA